LREELVRLRGLVMDLSGKSGLVIAAAGTHPFSSWMTQEITPLERYAGVKQDLQDLAQQLLIFGTVAVLIFGAFSYFVTKPVRAETEELNNQIAQLKQKNEAARIAKAAEACALAGSIAEGVAVSMDIEQLIYEAGRLQDAASLLNRLSRD